MIKLDTKTPGGAGTPSGGENPTTSKSASDAQKDTPKVRSRKRGVTFAFVTSGLCVRVTGSRNIQTLRALIAAGSAGLTSGDFSKAGWARRTSAYILILRKLGIPISMQRERTRDGARVGRYCLDAPMKEVPKGQGDD